MTNGLSPHQSIDHSCERSHFSFFVYSFYIQLGATRRYNDICHHFSQAQQTQSVDQLKTCFHQAAVLAESLKSEFENRLEKFCVKLFIEILLKKYCAQLQ